MITLKYLATWSEFIQEWIIVSKTKLNYWIYFLFLSIHEQFEPDYEYLKALTIQPKWLTIQSQCKHKKATGTLMAILIHQNTHLFLI